MKYRDLREWIDQVKAMDQLQLIHGAQWDLEIGGLTEIICKKFKPPPALLFDNIPGYPEGHRVLVNMLDSVERLALTTGLDPQITPVQFIHKWREKIKRLSPVPPTVVKDGPVLENVRTGSQVNVLEFPAPRWHEMDGGRYLGTANLVITRDPDEGWVNAGTYRVMVQNENTVSVYISPGKQGRIQRQKYFDLNRPCPVAIVFGQDPLLFVAASTDVPYGMSEYEYAGGIREEPISVIPGPVTGLPIPAHAEIAVEGEMHPGDLMPEGPFGEWTGYYASARRSEPVVRVQSIMFRNDPILCGAPPMRPSVGQGFYRSLERSALIWNALEEAGVPDVTAVYSHPAAGRFLTIVAIRQRYPGHAKQAAVVAGQCRAGGYLGRYVIVVDEDVDIYDTEEVLWALCTRSDPERSIDILRRCWSGPLDPIIPKGRKGFNSRAIIDATRPFEWKDEFPPVSEISNALKDQLEGKWRALLSGLAREEQNP
ncbi:MAG: UbiD family decarboxylase [Candidatus Tectomicrobia bacterium]|uniref:UbiD family decarboxylase n=1 Tax=Tectimicrobiota bacterium TaxID=2528274 RepID=A0A932M0J3_UNCTE|nr:UbiD family decarboxylase [Candidatus Tectomicrobia bacterium]